MDSVSLLGSAFWLGVGAVFTFLVPIVLLVVLLVRRMVSSKPLALGFAAFGISQLVLRIPLLSVLSLWQPYVDWATAHMWLQLLLVGGLSAGLFEETARLGVACLLNRKGFTYKDVISFGLGHGLCEVILLVGLSQISSMATTLAIAFAPEMMQQALGAQFDLVISQLAAVSPLTILLSLVERLGAVSLHVFNTVLVFRAVRQRQPLFYLAALAVHTAGNFLVVAVNLTVGAVPAEGLMLLIGAACLAGTLAGRKAFAQ